MSVQNNQLNLIWHDQEKKTKGEWLTIFPDNHAWSQIAKVQTLVQDKMDQFFGNNDHQQTPRTWALSEKKFTHITLYMGFDKPLTLNQKKGLLEKVAEKVAGIPQFTIDPKCTLEYRKNSRHVVLKLDSSYLYDFRRRVKEAVEQFIIENPENISLGDWHDKEYIPHLTIGSLNINKDPKSRTAEEIKEVNKLRYRMGSWWRKVQNVSTKAELPYIMNIPLSDDFRLPIRVTEFELTGVDDPQLPREQKKYYTLAKVHLSEPNTVKQSEKQKCESRLTKALLHIAPRLEIKSIEKNIDEAGKPTVHVFFRSSNSEKEYISRSLGNARIHFCENSSNYFIRLGEFRLKKLLGDKDSQHVYQILGAEY